MVDLTQLVAQRAGPGEYDRRVAELSTLVAESGYAELVAECALGHSLWATSSKIRKANIASRFAKVHLKAPWIDYAGREFVLENLLGALQCYRFSRAISD